MKKVEHDKAQFMMVMVHELKSPVAAAKTMIDTLQYHDIDDPGRTECDE